MFALEAAYQGDAFMDMVMYSWNQYEQQTRFQCPKTPQKREPSENPVEAKKA